MSDKQTRKRRARQLRSQAADLEARVSNLTGMIATLETERLKAIVEASRLRAEAERYDEP